MEQLVARWAHNPKAVGSSPAPATLSSGIYAGAFFMVFILTIFFRIFLIFSIKKLLQFKPKQGSLNIVVEN